MRLKTNFSLYHYYTRIGEEILTEYFLSCTEADYNRIKELPDVVNINFADLPDQMAIIAEGHYEFNKSVLLEIINKGNNRPNFQSN
jgi:hypothetical protein